MEERNTHINVDLFSVGGNSDSRRLPTADGSSVGAISRSRLLPADGNRWLFLETPQKSLCFGKQICYNRITSLGGTAKRTARYACHPPTVAGG